MDVAAVLGELGGVAARADLLALASRVQLDRAVAEGTVVRTSRGRLALAETAGAVLQAQTAGGVLCLTSAALHHGWAVKHVPVEPHVSVPRGRKVSPSRRRGIRLHRHDLHPDDHDGVATSREVTLLQCLRSLPFDEALCLADSALRDGQLATLRRVGAIARGAGAAQVRRVARLASADAANPFETCLRAIALTVPGLHVAPQVTLTAVPGAPRPDLVDADLRMVLEADSFAWHGDRAALRRDARRYHLMVVHGWLVLRFSWEDVIHHADEVREVLLAATTQRRTEVTCARCSAA